MIQINAGPGCAKKVVMSVRLSISEERDSEAAFGDAWRDSPETRISVAQTHQTEELPVFLKELPPGATVPKHFNMGNAEQLRKQREEAERQERSDDDGADAS